MINQYDNLIVFRSFSKGLALAGLRIGYAAGSKQLIQKMKSVQEQTQPFEVNRLAIVAAQEALITSHKLYYPNCRK